MAEVTGSAAGGEGTFGTVLGQNERELAGGAPWFLHNVESSVEQHQSARVHSFF